ncbi:MAG: DUF2569 family protein [Terracidiphilus sp.]
MTDSCARCSSPLDEGSILCAHCGAAVSTDPSVAEAAPATAPIFKTFNDRKDLEGIGGWLILPAIGLAITPFITFYNLFGLDIPALSRYGSGLLLNGHSGLIGLLVFEIIMNIILLAGAIGLNILLYSKKRIFPKCMIIFLTANFLFILGDQIAVSALLASADRVSGITDVIRAFIGAVIWIPYFLNSQRVAQTFVN